MRKHKVEFYSPGTFFCESSSFDIDSWDVKAALLIHAKGIEERHGAKPFGFRFKTLIVADPIPDGEGGFLAVQSKEVASSGYYFITGTLRTYDQIKEAAKKDEQILLGNMRANNWPIVVENRNSYRHTQQFNEDDVIVDLNGDIIDRGDSIANVSYRAVTLLKLKEERGY